MKSKILFFSLSVLLSCKKENGAPKDTVLPLINMTSPTNNQVFAAGQTVNINGNITDNDKLEEVHLELQILLQEHF